MTPLAAYVAVACRLYILVVLAAAVLGKASSPAAFRMTLAGLPWLPERAAGAAALALIVAEAAILVAVAIAPSAGMAAALAMFALFWLAILAALAARRPMVCNCFGGGARPVSPLDLVRNLVMAGACAFFLLAPPPPGLAPSAWLLLLPAALIAFLVSTHLDDIAELAR
jgi:hypothetical protein